MVFTRHPRLSLSVLAVLLFIAGFVREQVSERTRVQTLVESSAQANKDFAGLMEAYELRLNTVHALVTHALKHKVAVPSSLALVLESLDEKPKVADSAEMLEYQGQQSALGAAARDLIAAMDVDLSAGDSEFARIFSDFTAQDADLARVKASYALVAERIRALARKGDRRILSPDVRLPAAAE